MWTPLPDYAAELHCLSALPARRPLPEELAQGGGAGLCGWPSPDECSVSGLVRPHARAGARSAPAARAGSSCGRPRARRAEPDSRCRTIWRRWGHSSAVRVTGSAAARPRVRPHADVPGWRGWARCRHCELLLTGRSRALSFEARGAACLRARALIRGRFWLAAELLRPDDDDHLGRSLSSSAPARDAGVPRGGPAARLMHAAAYAPQGRAHRRAPVGRLAECARAASCNPMPRRTLRSRTAPGFGIYPSELLQATLCGWSLRCSLRAALPVPCRRRCCLA